MITLLFHIFGLDNASGPWYLFWSGIGSDISELAIVGGLIAFWRKHTCHVGRCWRFARHAHTVDGVTYQLCSKHHPIARKDPLS